MNSPLSLRALLPLVLSSCFFVSACSDDDPPRSNVPWMPNETTVISEGGEYGSYGTPGAMGCVVAPDTEEEVCFGSDVTCADETTADVVVDDNGVVLDVVCIPPSVDAVTELDLADGEIDQTSNSTALVFGAGGVFEGDLAVDGNNVVLYGNGPDESTLDGDLHITGNNAIVRGVTITGDLNIDKNGAVVVFCRVLGNVTLSKNNTVLSGCEIHGTVTVLDNNSELHGNSIAGGIEDSGQGTVCDGNVSFSDVNENQQVDEGETGEDLGC